MTDAFAPAMQIVDLLRNALQDAAARGQVHPDAATDPGSDWDHGRYTRRYREILPLFINAYPPRT